MKRDGEKEKEKREEKRREKEKKRERDTQRKSIRRSNLIMTGKNVYTGRIGEGTREIVSRRIR